MRLLTAIAMLVLSAMASVAEPMILAPQIMPEWKPVYGRVEARDDIPARARIGGIVTNLLVSEGDIVKAGQQIALLQDDKLALQVAAHEATLRALGAELETAQSDLDRGISLQERGVISAQRLDQLRTEADVIRNRIDATRAERDVVIQRGREGEVLAPIAGRVLTVPVTEGAVIMAGEPVATIGGGGVFLRLAIPERHSGWLKEGAAIGISTASGPATGRLAKVYPQIENGRVLADVEVDDLDSTFIGARLLVDVPVGERKRLLVPERAISLRSGLDFVQVLVDGETHERVVIPGAVLKQDGESWVEILSGLMPGEIVQVP